MAKGTLNFIIKNLPEPWEKFLIENKCKTEFCNLFYAKLPRWVKNKYHYKDGIALSRRRLRSNSILEVIDLSKLDQDRIALYKKIDDEIKTYKYLCN